MFAECYDVLMSTGTRSACHKANPLLCHKLKKTEQSVTCRQLLEATSHTLTVLSELAVATLLPLGLNIPLQISLSCPTNVA